MDANCAWTPEIAVEMLEHVLIPHKRRIFMVEQPFPVELTVYRTDEEGSEAIQAWTQVHELYQSHDLLIFADESMRTAADVPRLRGLVDGVNIKMEKCGGIAEGCARQMLPKGLAFRSGSGAWLGQA